MLPSDIIDPNSCILDFIRGSAISRGDE